MQCPMLNWYAVSEDRAKLNQMQEITWDQEADDSDARIAARLKRILEIPGISDKDRKLVERNLKRILEAQERRKPA